MTRNKEIKIKYQFIIVKTKFNYKLFCSQWLQLLLNIFLLDMNFDKYTIELHFFLYLLYLQNFKIKD